MAVPFDNTGKCNGEGSQPCLTCGRYTLKPGAPVKGKVYTSQPVRTSDGRLIGGGFRDCEKWLPHDLDRALSSGSRTSLGRIPQRVMDAHPAAHGGR